MRIPGVLRKQFICARDGKVGGVYMREIQEAADLRKQRMSRAWPGAQQRSSDRPSLETWRRSLPRWIYGLINGAIQSTDRCL